MIRDAMTLHEIMRFIRDRVTYKPGYTLHVHLHPLVVEINLSVPTGTDSHGTTPGRYDVTYGEVFTLAYLEGRDAGWVMGMVRQFLFRWEQHECEEWYRIDGAKARDPHSTSVCYADGEPV